MTITSLQLYQMLDREFQTLRKPGRCRCRAPMPYWRTPPDDVSANWDVATLASCPNGCHLVIAELVARMWTRFDMEPERAQ